MINIIVFVLNTALVAALFVSYAAVYVNPDLFYIPAFFGLAYPFIMVANVIMMLWWVAQLHLKFLMSLFALLSGWSFIGRTITYHSQATPDSTALCVMSYNVMNFGFEKNANLRDDILKLVSDEQPDILCLQEYCNNKTWKIQLERTFAEAINAEQYFFHNVVADKNTAFQAGTLIISKYPILGTGEVPYDTPSGNSTIYADIDVKGTTVRVFNVHLQSIRFQNKDYRFLREFTDDKDKAIEESKSILARMRQAFVMRAAQAQKIREAVKASPHKVILCGDFNDSPVSYAYQQISHNLKDAFEEKGRGLGRSYIGEFPRFRIDYIMCSENFTVQSFEVVHKKLSDHYPVKAHIVVK